MRFVCLLTGIALLACSESSDPMMLDATVASDAGAEPSDGAVVEDGGAADLGPRDAGSEMDGGVMPIDSGVGTSSTCGVSQPPQGTECQGLEDCGDPGNFDSVSFCDHCLSFGNTELCESGQCKVIDRNGFIQIAFTVPLSAVGAMSFTVALLNPVAGDGTQVSCQALIESCRLTQNPQLNVSNAFFRNILPPGAESGIVYTVLGDVDVGSGRIALVEVETNIQGTGNVVARGCVEGIDVQSGQTTNVQLALDPP